MKKKRFAVLLLLSVFIILLFCREPVNAETSSVEVINPFYLQRYPDLWIDFSGSSRRQAASPISCHSTSELITILSEQMTGRQTSFSVRLVNFEHSFSFAQVETIIDDALAEVLGLDDYLRFSYGGYRYNYSGTDNDVEVVFTVAYDTTSQQEAEISTRVSQILAANLTAGMNDEEKAKAIHDWVVLNVAYDESLVRHSIYDALFYRSAVCEGYALLMYKLLKTAGIGVRIIDGSGNGGAHAWNLVYLCTDWFHVDATWDDPVPDRPGRVSYDYYNLSDSQMDDDHIWDHSLYASFAAPHVYVEGICNNTPAYLYSYYVPYLSNDPVSSRWTGVALANAENIGTDVRITCYGLSGGAPLDQKEEHLPALGQAAFPAVTPSGADGWIKIESTRKLDGLALIGQSYPPLLFDMDMQSSLHQNFLLAHLAADGVEWDSLIMACNPNAATANLTYSYYNQAGQMVTSRPSSIPAGGSVQDNLHTVFGQNLAGSVVIESSQPITAFMLYDSKTTDWRAGLSALPLD
ncbi:MAG: hypothetical protein JXR80_05750 [Deltaproteobacteria bacterium]|nr:hypothetical protein [Deltaproteobacteria bacterium]